MADPTTTALAQMLGIDVSSIGDDAAASQLVIDTVGEMAMDLHALIDDEEVDPNAEQDDEQDDDEIDDSDVDTEEDDEPQQQQQRGGKAPMFGKKGAKRMAVAASRERVTVPPAHLKMLQQNRFLQLSQLVDGGNILPVVAERLYKRYGSPKACALALSSANDDGFDETIAILAENQAFDVEEQTGLQTIEFGGRGTGRGLALSQDELRDPTKNSLLAAASRRAAARQPKK